MSNEDAYVMDHTTGKLVLTAAAQRGILVGYLAGVGLRVPTLKDTPLANPVPVPEDQEQVPGLPPLKAGGLTLFVFAGSTLAARAHIKTALLRYIREELPDTYPTYTVVALNSMLNRIMDRDPGKADRFEEEDILFILAEEPYFSEPVQKIICNLLSGRTASQKTTVFCTHGMVEWFTKPECSHPPLQALMGRESTLGIVAGAIVDTDIKNANGCITSELR